MKWEMVVGLETHVELSTKTKIFCSCSTEFGGEPNSHCCPVCTGQPGALPMLNRAVVEYAVTAGLALGCTINRRSVMARKHYVYPDLPKAFQISQFDRPLCSGGGVSLSDGSVVRLTRIHIEEDAGKLIHEGGSVYIDYNRGGVPLIEIVTEPDLRSAAGAVEYLEKLQGILRAAGVSDCRMQEGSLRCDVNISVRPQGEERFGTRTEIKNLNSFTSVRAALDYEFERQTALLERGERVVQETLRFDPSTGETSNMRGKENADDYRYFPEPDILPVELTDEDVERLRAALPELPEARQARYTGELGVSEADAKLLSKYRAVSDYFEAAAAGVKNPRTAAGLITTQLFALITTEKERERWSPAVSPEALSELVRMQESGKLNASLMKRLFGRMAETGWDAPTVIARDGIELPASVDVAAACRKAIDENPGPVADYRAGKQKALQALVGAVMRSTRGAAPAGEVTKLLTELLSV